MIEDRQVSTNFSIPFCKYIVKSFGSISFRTKISNHHFYRIRKPVCISANYCAKWATKMDCIFLNIIICSVLYVILHAVFKSKKRVFRRLTFSLNSISSWWTFKSTIWLSFKCIFGTKHWCSFFTFI